MVWEQKADYLFNLLWRKNELKFKFTLDKTFKIIELLFITEHCNYKCQCFSHRDLWKSARMFCEEQPQEVMIVLMLLLTSVIPFLTCVRNTAVDLLLLGPILKAVNLEISIVTYFLIVIMIIILKYCSYLPNNISIDWPIPNFWGVKEQWDLGFLFLPIHLSLSLWYFLLLTWASVNTKFCSQHQGN